MSGWLRKSLIEEISGNYKSRCLIKLDAIHIDKSFVSVVKEQLSVENWHGLLSLVSLVTFALTIFSHLIILALRRTRMAIPLLVKSTCSSSEKCL